MSDQSKHYEDFLDGFLSDIDETFKQPILPSNKPNSDISNGNTNIPKAKRPNISNNSVINNGTINISEYDEIALDDLPLGHLYHTGTKMLYRDLSVKEVEFFATLDTDNGFDFKSKLNSILDGCVVFMNPDGTYGTYLDIKEGDRVWVLYTIREKSFLSGHKVQVNVSVQDKEGNKSKYGIELKRAHIELWDSTDMLQYFNLVKKYYQFVYVNGSDEIQFDVAPPTIGLSNCFDQYLKLRYDELKQEYKIDEIKDLINYKFFQIAPFLKPHITFMDYDEIKEFEKWFENIPELQFYFLDDLLSNHLRLGIRGLKKNVDGTEIRTNNLYPKKPRDFFYVSNAFGLFLRK